MFVQNLNKAKYIRAEYFFIKNSDILNIDVKHKICGIKRQKHLNNSMSRIKITLFNDLHFQNRFASNIFLLYNNNNILPKYLSIIL